ncbi:hypothetical protein ABES02_16600 [Neobacillus pocheonensis]
MLVQDMLVLSAVIFSCSTNGCITGTTVMLFLIDVKGRLVKKELD